MYEGYGPGGVALLIECLTDNRNRAASEVRVALSRNGGSLAEPGSVSYLFSRRGMIEVPTEGVDEDNLFEVAVESGADDVVRYGDVFRITSDPSDMVAVRTALQSAGIDYNSAEAEFEASVEVPVDLEGAKKVMRLIDALDDSDDVQNVFSNVDISEEVAAALEEED